MIAKAKPLGTTDKIKKMLAQPAEPTAPQPTKPAAPKLPKSLAACADLLYTTQQARFALNKQAETLQAVEVAIRARFIEELRKESTGVAGKLARVSIETKTIVSTTDKVALRKWADAQIKKNPDQRDTWYKFNADSTAIKALWEAGKKVPGAERMHVPTVSLHKL